MNYDRRTIQASRPIHAWLRIAENCEDASLQLCQRIVHGNQFDCVSGASTANSRKLSCQSA